MVISTPRYLTEAIMIEELNTFGDPPDNNAALYGIFFILAIFGCVVMPFHFYWGFAFVAPVAAMQHLDRFKDEDTYIYTSVGIWIAFVLYIVLCIGCFVNINATETAKHPLPAIVAILYLLAIYLSTIRVVGMRKEVDAPNNEIRYYKRQYSNIIPLNYRYIETLYKTEPIKRPRPTPPSVTSSGRK